MNALPRQSRLKMRKRKSIKRCALTVRHVSTSAHLKLLLWVKRFASRCEQRKMYRLRDVRERMPRIRNIDGEWKSMRRQGYVCRMWNLCWCLPFRIYPHGIDYPFQSFSRTVFLIFSGITGNSGPVSIRYNSVSNWICSQSHVIAECGDYPHSG